MTDPVWSIFVMMLSLLAGTTYYIYYRMMIAYRETLDGIHGTPKQEELLQLSLFEDQ